MQFALLQIRKRILQCGNKQTTDLSLLSPLRELGSRYEETTNHAPGAKASGSLSPLQNTLSYFGLLLGEGFKHLIVCNSGVMGLIPLVFYAMSLKSPAPISSLSVTTQSRCGKSLWGVSCETDTPQIGMTLLEL